MVFCLVVCFGVNLFVTIFLCSVFVSRSFAAALPFQRLLIYYKPRPRNYRVLHRALYNPRPQAEGCMRGVKPDNFEAEACNIFKFFSTTLSRHWSPLNVFLSKKKDLWRINRVLLLFCSSSVEDCEGRFRSAMKRSQLQLKQARLLSPVIEALAHTHSLSLSLSLAFSFFLSKKKELWRIDRVLFRSTSVLWRQVALRDEMCSTNACTWKKRARSTLAWPIQVQAVGVALGRVGAPVTRSHSVFLWRKKWCCHGSIAPAIAKIAT